MTQYSIGEIARRAALNASAIRYYERIGLLAAPERVRGRRVYGARTLHELRMIGIAKRAGFSLDQVRTLLRTPTAEARLSAQWRHLAEGRLREIERLMGELHAAREVLIAGMRCGCSSVEECAACSVD